MQGLDLPEGTGLAVPLTLARVAEERRAALARGYAVAVDSFLAGMAAMALPLRDEGGRALGCLSIAGPAVRLTPARMAALAARLAETAARIGTLAAGSAFFRGRG